MFLLGVHRSLLFGSPLQSSWLRVCHIFCNPFAFALFRELHRANKQHTKPCFFTPFHCVSKQRFIFHRWKQKIRQTLVFLKKNIGRSRKLKTCSPLPPLLNSHRLRTFHKSSFLIRNLLHFFEVLCLMPIFTIRQLHFITLPLLNFSFRKPNFRYLNNWFLNSYFFFSIEIFR